MRILLSKKSRKNLFNFLKKRHQANNLKELSLKINVPFKTLQKWRYGNLYLPDFMIPKEIIDLEIIEKKGDTWGQSKGGKIGNKEYLKKMWKNKEYREIMGKSGKKVMNKLWKDYGKNLIKMTVKGKMKKRELRSKKIEENNNSFFTNQRILLNTKGVNYSKKDATKNIIFPKEMSKELAEEIGAHSGDGCLSYNKNYFSIKCNKKEEEYMYHLFKIYKKLYNLDLKLMRLQSVSGFEIYSKALCEFKNKIIRLPYGEKVHKIEVPKVITETKDKEIYCSFIRGLFDTDGCIYLSKKRYPIISITIKSKKLIEELKNMLYKMGFLPYVHNYTLFLSGPTMLKKWIKEINSNNPVKIEKLERASSLVDKIFPCGSQE